MANTTIDDKWEEAVAALDEAAGGTDILTSAMTVLKSRNGIIKLMNTRVSDLNLTNSYTGLILPLVASATATFFFRQFYKSIPDELLESAKLDGANSWKFFIDFLLPLSKTMIAAMFIFMFVYGYSQYLWPLIMTTDEKYWTVVMGMKIIFQESYEGGNLPRVS